MMKLLLLWVLVLVYGMSGNYRCHTEAVDAAFWNCVAGSTDCIGQCTIDQSECENLAMNNVMMAFIPLIFFTIYHIIFDRDEE